MEIVDELAAAVATGWNFFLLKILNIDFYFPMIERNISHLPLKLIENL